MNFQQLRILRESVRRNYNLTEVANALYTSQSGVSKHIKDLEDELGVELFVRRGKRLLGLTEPGREVVEVVERMLRDADNVRQIAEQFARGDRGSLQVATTHTQARYALPEVIRWFKQTYPGVHLALHQGGPREIAQMVAAGEADIGIATEGLEGLNELATFPGYVWQHAIIVPAGHPLTARGPLTLEALADYPLITYHQGYTGRTHIDEAFAKAGLSPDIVLTAIDADVIKTYVELGLGVGILASMAFHPARDQGLTLLSADGLFPENTTRLAVRRGAYLRDFALDFITRFSPTLDPLTVRAAVAQAAAE